MGSNLNFQAQRLYSFCFFGFFVNGFKSFISCCVIRSVSFIYVALNSWLVLLQGPMGTKLGSLLHTFIWSFGFYTSFTEIHIHRKSYRCASPEVGRRAFLLSGDEPKLAGKPFYYWEMSLFLGNVLLKHLVKVKSIFGEIEFL